MRSVILPAMLTAMAAGSALAQDHAAGEAPHWSYQGETGPAEWGQLLAEYALCATGRNQSPVSIPGDAPWSTASLTFDYRPTRATIVNNGHTVQVNYGPGSTLSIDGSAYEIRQFHFHVPSEHLIDGVAAPLEMHIVHASETGSLAVVGVLFDLGEEDNAFLAAFWDELPAAGHEAELEAEIDVATAFASTAPTFSYSGSLTTPPCSEGVRWFVSETHETLSRAQLAELVSVIGINARPAQPLNGRPIGGPLE